MPIDAQKCHLAPAFREVLAGAQHCTVFDGARDDMFAARIELQRGVDYRIVRFCPAAGKDNFRGFTSQ